MSLTVSGEDAKRIVEWAYADPHGRALAALGRVNAMARHEKDQKALREIQDAGAMLSRLAGTVRTMPADTITSQTGAHP